MSGPAPVVYLVDDDASYLAATARLLRAAGYSVEAFSSASELLRKLPPDASGCVLADLRMPGLSGLDLQDALARSESPLPVVFVSGHGDVPTTAHAFRHGAEDFLTKLAPKEELLEAVERALARGARERAERERRRSARALLDPAAYDRRLSQPNEVAPSSVKTAAKKLLAKDHRVVVIAAPAKEPAEPKTP